MLGQPDTFLAAAHFEDGQTHHGCDCVGSQLYTEQAKDRHNTGFESGRNRYGVQGAHLNPLGLVLCTSTPRTWRILHERLPTPLNSWTPWLSGHVSPRFEYFNLSWGGERDPAGPKDFSYCCNGILDANFSGTKRVR